MIKGFHHAQITIPPGTDEEAKRFYCEILELKEIHKPESLLARGGFWVQVGHQQLHIGTEEGIDRLRTKAHLAYEVDDLAQIEEKLKNSGIEIISAIPISGFERFEFRDPFGNRVECIKPVL